MAVSTNVTLAPPAEAWTSVYDYTGTNLTYTGVARSFQPTFTLTSATISKAAAGVVTFVAHGLTSGQSATILGGTGDWVGVNGAQIITVLTADTFSIPVNTSGYAATFGGTVVTNAPRTNATCWTINLNYYNGSNQLIRFAWCNSNTSPIYAWDSRATYAFA